MNKDEVIQKAFPLKVAPLEAALETAADNGIRFVASEQGLWREVTLPWIRVRHLVAESQIKLPYGALGPLVESRMGGFDAQPFVHALAHARQCLPNESAGAIVWNAALETMRYVPRDVSSASPSHVHYTGLALKAGEMLVVDVHSHANASAYFSSTDDADDRGTMQLSLVLGDVGTDDPSTAMRLCLAGFFFPASIGEDGRLEVQL